MACSQHIDTLKVCLPATGPRLTTSGPCQIFVNGLTFKGHRTGAEYQHGLLTTR